MTVQAGSPSAGDKVTRAPVKHRPGCRCTCTLRLAMGNRLYRLAHNADDVRWIRDLTLTPKQLPLDHCDRQLDELLFDGFVEPSSNGFRRVRRRQLFVAGGALLDQLLPLRQLDTPSAWPFLNASS